MVCPYCGSTDAERLAAENKRLQDDIDSLMYWRNISAEIIRRMSEGESLKDATNSAMCDPRLIDDRTDTITFALPGRTAKAGVT